MGTVTIVVAPQEPGLAILSVLRDWSVLRLVTDFYWVTPDSIEPGTDRIEALAVACDGVRVVDLQGDLAAAGHLELVRICVVDPLDGTRYVEFGDRARSVITAAAPGVRQVLVECIVTALGATSPAAAHVPQGWHGVVIAPEDAQTPRSPRRQLRATDDPQQIAMHHACGLAGLLGLWSDLPDSPVDGLAGTPADQVRLARGYLHLLDASAFGNHLRNALTSVHPELPRPVSDNHVLATVSNEAGAVTHAADALFAQHGWVLRCDREAVPVRSARPIGFRRAVGMFWGFLWAAVRHAPRQWWERLVAKGARGLAAMTQHTVFGNESEYDVVVRGWLPNGRPATIADVEDATRRIFHRLEPSRPLDDQAAGGTEFWRDLHGVALDLADGGQRVPGAELPHVGGQRAVVRRCASIAPGPWETFTDIPPVVAATLDVDEISPSDLRTTQQVTERLDEMAQRRDGVAIAANHARSALTAWSEHTQRASFAGRVGVRLTETQRSLRAEIHRIRTTIAGLESSVSPDEPFAEEQKRLARTARWVFWGGVVVVAALLLSGARGWLPWDAALKLVAVAVVAEIVVQLMLFLRGQQALFQLLNRQRQLEDEAAVHLRNLSTALADLHRLDGMYQRFVPVAAALGSFVGQPLGVPVQPADGIELPGGALPHAMKVGRVSTEGSATSELLEQLRARLFPVGWMEDPYRAFLADAGRQLGPEGVEYGQEPARLFADPAVGPQAPLHRWAQALRRNGTPASLGDETWSRAVQLLTDADFMSRTPLGAQTVWAGGRAPALGLAVGLTADEAANAQFDTEILLLGARSGPGRVVDPAATLERRRWDGMSRRQLLVLLGEPFDSADLNIPVTEPRQAVPAHAPVEGPRI